MRIYGVIAISFAVMCPLFWTFRAYFIRLTVEDKSFVVYDMSIDTLFFQYSIALIIYFVYLAQHPFILSDFIQGNTAGFFMFMASICNTNSYRIGPGGPINALITSQIVYQTLINALLFGQGISFYELAGITLGITATLVISLWDLLDVGESFILPGNDGSHTKVVFRLLVFRPFMDEVLVGKIKSCTREGVHLSLIQPDLHIF